jgi:hypothetical protein
VINSHALKPSEDINISNNENDGFISLHTSPLSIDEPVSNIPRCSHLEVDAACVVSSTGPSLGGKALYS